MRRGRIGRQRRRRAEEDARILPLVNIVFLLLIFFMVAGRLSTADPFEVAVPRSESEGGADDAVPLVAMGAGGALALDGVLIAEADLLARLRAAGAGELRLKVDAGVPAVRAVALIERLRRAGVADISLLTQRPRVGG